MLNESHIDMMMFRQDSTMIPAFKCYRHETQCRLHWTMFDGSTTAKQ